MGEAGEGDVAPEEGGEGVVGGYPVCGGREGRGGGLFEGLEGGGGEVEDLSG